MNSVDSQTWTNSKDKPMKSIIMKTNVLYTILTVNFHIFQCVQLNSSYLKLGNFITSMK